MPQTPSPAAVPTRDARVLRRWRQWVLGLPEAPWLHQEVSRRMMDKLALIRAVPERLIDWGGGDGASAAALKGHYPKARRWVVEPLLADLLPGPQASWWRRWLGAAPDPWLSPGDLGPGQPAQLVWSNLHLHWSEDPGAVFSRWHAALETDGFVMFSCFGPDTLRELSERMDSLGWGPATVPFIDMHDLGDALVQAGFADPVMDMERLTLHWADAAALLSELRTLGANAATARHAGLRTPRWRRRLEAEIAAHLAGRDGRPALTFEIVYGHAFRPAARARVAAETQISEDQMRSMLRNANSTPR